jgi:hypothetical protein
LLIFPQKKNYKNTVTNGLFLLVNGLAFERLNDDHYKQDALDVSEPIAEINVSGMIHRLGVGSHKVDCALKMDSGETVYIGTRAKNHVRLIMASILTIRYALTSVVRDLLLTQFVRGRFQLDWQCCTRLLVEPMATIFPMQKSR